MNGNYRIGDEVLGGWKLTRLIGSGGFGSVYEAHRVDGFGIDSKAAIKIITIPQNEEEVRNVRSEGMDDASVTAYFQGFVEEMAREISIMGLLKGSENVVAYEDHAIVPHEGKIGWDIIIRMELLTPLLRYEELRPLNCSDTARLGLDICSALELCRKNGIIHRDIKPENIFVSDTGRFKLGDFGIARVADKTTGGLSRKGTFTYMAPEVYKGQAYGSSVDIYSLGLVMYRLLNNNRGPFLPPVPSPLTYNDRESALARRLGGEALPLPARAGNELGRVVLKACAFKSHDRFASPAEMKAALMTACSVLGYNIPWTYSGVSDFSGGGDEPTYAEWDEGGTSAFTEPVFDPQPSPKPPRRKVNRAFAIGAAAAAALVLCITAAMLFSGGLPGRENAVLPDPESGTEATDPVEPSSAVETPAAASPSPESEETSAPSPSPSPEQSAAPSPSPTEYQPVYSAEPVPVATPAPVSTPAPTPTPAPASLTLSSTNVTVKTGETVRVTASGGTGSYTWQANSNIISVDNGVIRGAGQGDATITVRSGTLSETIYVTVTEPDLSLSQSSLSLDKGDTYTLRAYTNLSDYELSWRSSDSRVVTVEDGRLEAVSVGEATVRVTMQGEIFSYTASCQVTVTAERGNFYISTDASPGSPISSYTGGAPGGESFYCFVDDQIIYSASWSTSDESIARADHISGGTVVWFFNPGTVTLTASGTLDGNSYSGSIVITIT